MFGTWTMPYPNGLGLFSPMCSDSYFGTVTNQTGTSSDTGSLTDYHTFDSGSPTHSIGAGWPPEVPSSPLMSAPGIFSCDDLPDGFGWITYGSPP